MLCRKKTKNVLSGTFAGSQISGASTVVYVISVILFVLLHGCASVVNRHPLPQNLVDSAEIEGIPDARIWGDELPPHYQSWNSKSKTELQSSFPGIINTEHSYLAISGGGPRGAYGAGLLAGWTESNSRPEFTIVTGVSVGALTAPFAFLGSDYDDELETLYTTYYTDDLIHLKANWRDSFASSNQLKKVIAKYVNDEMLSALAVEYRKGRRVYIITTNLDASRPMMWDLGAIVESGSPKALQLIRDVILASASIPVLMPPVDIGVEVNGEYYDEMHVDGGVSSQVMFYPPEVDLRLINKKLGTKGRPTIYVIRNGYIHAPYKPVKRKLIPIMAKSFESLIQAQGVGDLYRIYLSSLRDDLEYRLAFIPPEFDIVPQEVGGINYMKQLFEFGRMAGRDGTAWHEAPPDVEAHLRSILQKKYPVGS
jgi:predicted patatin/cPLA2 family phospholipase